MTMSVFAAALSSSPLPSTPNLPPRPQTQTNATISPPSITRRALLSVATVVSAAPSLLFPSSKAASSPSAADFFEIPGSGGVKALELRFGAGEIPADGDQVAIHYYGRLAAKQGWRFDSTYDHKDEMGGPVPFIFVIGSGKVERAVSDALEAPYFVIIPKEARGKIIDCFSKMLVAYLKIHGELKSSLI